MLYRNFQANKDGLMEEIHGQVI